MTAPFGSIGAWGHLDSLAAPEARAYARRVDELGYGALWVPETVGREPFTLLGHPSGVRPRLGYGEAVQVAPGADGPERHGHRGSR